jgi:hypothetical protein
MARKQSDLDDLKTATAGIVSCIVQTLGESDPSFSGRFEHRLDDWYAEMRNNRNYGPHALEMLSWAREAARSDRPLLTPDERG